MGGYKIIDFQDADLKAENADGITIKGIYSAIENNYRKPLLLHGITIEGVEKSDTYAEATAGDQAFTFTVYGHTITVSALDVVKITANA